MAEQVVLVPHTKETDTDELETAASASASDDPMLNGELDPEAPCCHVSMKMSIDAATPRLCDDACVPLKCDATSSVDATASSSSTSTAPADVAASQLPPSPPPVQAMPARSSTPPCQLLERLNFPEGNIINTLHTILALPPFDPYAPAPKSETVYKEVVSLMQWSLREDNAIELQLSDKLLHECEHKSGGDPNDETRSYLMAIENMRLFSEDPKNPLRDADGQLRAITNLAFIFVKHRKEEFFTFCSCKECLEYRETIMAIMMDQFKAAHMVVMLLDVLIKAYSPMLKNDAAYNKFEKLLECNKEIYWITSGYLYDKNAEYLDFIDDTAISDNMILVLFSAILMANNPMLLLQILAYNVECIVKAFSEGMIEIAQNIQENEKISAERMLTYILDGYSDLNCISQKISLSLFAFENDFLRKFKLSWVLLCQRLFQQHVFTPLGDTMLACILSLKEVIPSAQTTALIKRYMLFDEHMHSIERRWTDIWIELNKFNLSPSEHERRMGLLDVYNIFDKVVLDATSFSLPDISDDEFIDFQRIVDRQLAWKNIMAFTKLKWPDGFYDPPNKLVHEDLCKKCNSLLEHYNENCKCITCSIAGTPMRPRQAGHCAKCTTLSIVEKDPKLMKSKILSTCTNDEAKHNAATASTSSAAQQHLQRRSSDLPEEESTSGPGGGGNSSSVFRRQTETTTDTLRTTYHIAWAVFQHLTTRKRYRHDLIEAQFFCGENCRVSACQLARKILANQLSPPLTKYLLRCFQPLSFTREELRSTLPSLMFFNRKLAPSPAELQELRNQHYVYKTYWTFVLSIYANFFVKFNSSSTDFGHLELQKGDLRLRLNSVVGDKDDGRFEQFLAQVIGYSPFKITDDFTLGDANIEKMQFGVDQLMMLHDSQIIKRTKPDSTTGIPGGKSKAGDHPNMSQSGNRSSGDAGANKKSKEKMRKCCADYADIGEPCKENHSKKRVKKECNHARFNETRDRLRKKLSQIVSDRKSKSVEEVTAAAPAKATSESVAVQPAPAAASPPKRPPKAEAALPPSQPPSLKVFATAQLQQSTCTKTTKVADVSKQQAEQQEAAGDNSLLCLDSLCKSIQMQTDATAAAANAAAAAAAVAGSTAFSADYSKEDMMQDFAEFLGTYTREQDQQRWINETLNFIEGKSQQPQTANPKKAAKKAKQKMRKEEEKRIKELEDMRGQFLDIYFKEFIDKYEMKALTAAGGRKREKKRIGELEANIKNLQRAKAKVETVILELIATVKQTNNEFKFSYLPTKEQQLAKMAQLEELLNGGGGSSTTVVAAPAAEPEAPSVQCPEFSPSSFYTTPVCYAPPQHPQKPQQLSRDVIAAMAANSITADPSKRIVTIRRVQLPHPGAEQQVTVVAKGSAPHEDKLLYTFVNGHMVASSAPVPSEVAPSYPIAAPAPAAAAAPTVPEKSAKARKKEAKRAAAAAAAAAEQEAKANNSKKQAKNTAVPTTASSSTTCSTSSKSQTPQSTRESSVCSVKKPKTAPKKPSTIKPPPPVPMPGPVPKPQEPPKKQKRVKSRLDPGQLDNNPFKSLHMQDSSEGEWETGSESSEPSVKMPTPPPKAAVPAPKPVAAPPVISTKQKPASSASSAPAKKARQPEVVPKQQPAPQSAKAPNQAKGKVAVAPAPTTGGKLNPQSQHAQEKVAPGKAQSQRPAESTRKQKQQAAGQQLESNRSAHTQQVHQTQQQQQLPRGGRGNNGRAKSSSSGGQQQQQQPVSHSNAHQAEGSAPSKRTQRGKRGHRQKQEDLSGIPHNMGYFNPNEVAIPPSQTGSYASTLTQQMQHLRIGQSSGSGSGSSSKQQLAKSANCSIMDQLNRGVQVEHLALPPGITLTKVDPAKSEQLRQKSESIRLLSKPLAEQQQQHQHHFQQPSHSLAGYYGAAGDAGMDPNGVIMVEANPRPIRSSHIPNVAAAAAASAASASGKSSRRRRRNRGKSGAGSGGASGSSGAAHKQRSGGGEADGGAGMGVPTASIETSAGGNIITLRNPMFHQGNNGQAPSGGMLPPNPNPVPSVRNFPGAGLPIAAPPMAMDQPAAIIKNDNGMFTIRNPALHQAVTNGLAMGGYRQFGSNVNYYTPQEAVAEAARATQHKQQLPASVVSTASSQASSNNSTFSYFSSGSSSVNSSGSSNSGGGGVGGTHNNISISCTNVPSSSGNSPGRLVGEAAVIARPKHSQQKCLSAIGSELKQKTKDSKWPCFAPQQQQQQPPSAADYHPAAGGGGGVPLQEKYQQSSYYNGFEVFSAASPGGPSQVSAGGGGGGGSSDCHMHHSCGDDSPPPTITGFNSYLEGIPNTGVIRYDDAAFLKNLIPGQHLNNEVSIHNISESNFSRNNASSSPHHVEITSVFSNRVRPLNAYDSQQSQQPGGGGGANYCDNVVGDYGNDSHLFVQNSLLTRMQPQPPPAPPDPFGYDFDPSMVAGGGGGGSKAASVASDLNEFLRRSPLSQRTSPYTPDENAAALETFVQNMNALQIASEAEQCSRLNGLGGDEAPVADATAGGADRAASAWW